MRLTLYALLLAVVQGHALGSYAQSTKLNLSMENTTIKEVLQEIEYISEFRFLYNSKMVDVDRNVSVNFKDETIHKALDKLFKGTGVEYRVVDRQVVLFSEDEPVYGVGYAQQQSVSGTVTDEDGQPLPGVTVIIKGSTQGTITSSDGEYNLTDIPEDATLVFSFVGMRTQEVVVGDQQIIDVRMEAETIGLEEVVAIGYGTTTKRRMVSALSTIKTDKIVDVPYSTVVHGLAGRTPGLFVRESGGEYGSLPTISIRGGGEPLYVIDNIVSSKSEFAMIPPEDIEEITFLKDASATAVYGMNSANGIVLITTKQGAEGDIRIVYNGNLAYQQPTLNPEYMSQYERSVMINEAAFNDGLPQVISDEILNTMKNNLDPDMYPTYIAYDKVVRDFSAQNRHNVSLNGTIKDTKVYMSLDYFNQQGIYKVGDQGQDRFSFRANLSHTFDEIGLTVISNITAQRGINKYPARGTWEIWSHVRNAAPGTILFNPEGNYMGLENPIAEADSRAGYRNNQDNRVNGLMTFSWNVPWIKGLNLKAVGNFNLFHEFNKHWVANQRYSAPIYLWDNTPVDMGLGSLSESTGQTWGYNLETHVNYNRTFADDHTIEFTGVYTERESRYDGFNAYRRDFISSAVDELFAGSSVGKDNNGNASEFGRRGYVGRLKYDFRQKYIIEGSFRYDGNDNFPEEKRWGFFPAVSLGWNMEEEPFMEPVLNTLKLSSLKLRGSIGRTGNDAGVSRFAYIPSYSLINNAYFFESAWVTGFREGNLVSNELTWYTRDSKNLGVDFSFLNRKLSGTFDWFYYRETGYLGSPSSRYITPLGKALPEIKTNSAHRRGGVEASLNYKAQIGQVDLALGGNISYYDQLWESKYDEDSVSLKNPYMRLTHQTDYYTLGLINEGYYTSMEEILDSPRRLAANQTKPGDLIFEDFNGDGKIDNEDNVRIGKGNFPHIIYGVTLDAIYKGFSFSTLFQGTSNREIYLGYMWQNEINHKLYTIQGDNWSEDNPGAMFPRASTISQVNGQNNQVTSSFWLKDAWYLRMKSLSLSYNFKQSILKNMTAVHGLSLVLSGTNIFTISPVNKYYMDPETADNQNYGYPVLRTYNLGVKVIF